MKQIAEAGKVQKNKKPKSKEEDGRSMKKDVAAWQKKVATVQKGLIGCGKLFFRL